MNRRSAARRRPGESGSAWLERVWGSKPIERWTLVILLGGLGVAAWFLEPVTLVETLLWPVARYAFPVIAAALLLYSIYSDLLGPSPERRKIRAQERLDPAAERRVRSLVRTYHIPPMPPRLTKPIAYDLSKLASTDAQMARLRQIPWGRVEPLISVADAPQAYQRAQELVRDVTGDWRKLAEPTAIYSHLPAPWCWLGAAQVTRTRAFLMGNTYSPTGVRQALYFLSEALALDPNNVDAWLMRANLLRANGDSKRLNPAQDALQRARQIAPDSPDLPNVEAQVFSTFGRLDLAEQAAREAVRRGRTQQDWIGNQDSLALILLSAKRPSEAADVYQQVVAVEQDNPWIWHNYSLALSSAKRYQEALDASDRALALMEFGVARQRNNWLRKQLGLATQS